MHNFTRNDIASPCSDFFHPPSLHLRVYISSASSTHLLPADHFPPHGPRKHPCTLSPLSLYVEKVEIPPFLSLSPSMSIYPLLASGVSHSGWMSHRKQEETKQQPSMLPCSAVPGCCLVSFHCLCDIHSIHSVQFLSDIEATEPSPSYLSFFSLA